MTDWELCSLTAQLMRYFSMFFIVISIVLMTTGCNSNQDTIKSDIPGVKFHNFITTDGSLHLKEYQRLGFTQEQARAAIYVAFPEFKSCYQSVHSYSEKYIPTERCKCQIKWLPRKNWSRKALIYELGHTTDLLNETLNNN